MPLNHDLKGKVYGEVTYAVERDRVLQFADAIGEDNPIYRDVDAARAAGYPEQLAPPTFVTVMQIMTSGQAVVDPDLGLDYSLVVHGEQEYEWRRPVMVGDRLRTTPRLAEISAKGPNEYLVIESVIEDEAGATVVVARTTLLSRGTARPDR
jgi:acyl dehydratase